MSIRPALGRPLFHVVGAVGSGRRRRRERPQALVKLVGHPDFRRLQRGADLLEATLSKAVLLGTDLPGTNLSRADLSRARVDGATQLDRALMLDTRVEPKHDRPR